MTTTQDLLDPITALTQDLRRASVSLSDKEARYLVDSYYIMQEDRKRAHSQIRALEETQEPHEVVSWLGDNSQKLEDSIRRVLHAYAAGKQIGQWSLSVTGVGPVIAAGLLAHIEMDKATGVSNLWSFAGLNPEAEWGKGQKRPWNAALKTLCWKIGESFIKTSNNPNSFYGPYYRRWKDQEEAANEAGEFADQAAAILASKNLGKETVARQAYERGKLPPAHIHSRVRRKVVKLFLSHWWEVAYEVYHGTPPAVRPYVVDRLGHKDYIPPPNWPMR